MSQPPRDFARFCDENDWDPAFYQTLPDFLPMYERYGFAKMELGEDAIVNLRRFTLEKRVAEREQESWYSRILGGYRSRDAAVLTDGAEPAHGTLRQGDLRTLQIKGVSQRSIP